MLAQREAPEISRDPVADSSDLYAFVSPDRPDTATIIASYAPAFSAQEGFAEFGDDVLYEIHVDSNGDARPDLTYQFRFRTELRDDRTFLYNIGPIGSLDSANWNRRQFYSVTRVDAGGKQKVLARELPCPPCNVGPRSIPDYGALAADAVHELETGETVFAGQRAGTFPSGTTVHSIAVQVPLTAVRRSESTPVIGVWTSASRRDVQITESGDDVYVGPLVQVSRLGNPLVDRLVIPATDRARWNSLPPSEDKRFAEYFEHPELAVQLVERHPGEFPRLEAVLATGQPRTDLVELLLGPAGGIQADLLRLDTAAPVAGFPNGRWVTDDVATSMMQAIAGAALPDPDPATAAPLATFPYLGTP